MNLIDEISESLSSKKNRRILWGLLLIFFGSLIYICLCSDEKADALSTMLNILQALLMIVTLGYLLIHTNKKESLRYKNNPFFYLERYQDEIKRFLVIKKTNELRFYSTLLNEELDCIEKIKISKGDRSLIYHELKTQLQSYLLSNSVLEYAPVKKTLISDLEFLKLDSNYNLPWFIANLGHDLLVKKFNISEKFDYNGTTLSLNKFKQEPEGKLIFEFSKSFYYNYLVTNMMPEFKVMQNATVRDLLEPNKRLNRLEDSLAENHLGLSALIVTKDNFLIIPQRTANTTVFKGQLSPSVSGAANILTCSGDDGKISAKNWFIQELKEELSDIFSSEDIKNNLDINKVEFIGMSREIKRLGKPEIFFFCKLSNVTGEQLLKHKLVHNLFGDSIKSNEKLNQGSTFIDEHENEKYFIANIDKFIESIDVSLDLKKLWNQDCEVDYCVTVSEPQSRKVSLVDRLTRRESSKKMILSESLLVNCIFYLKHMKKVELIG